MASATIDEEKTAYEELEEIFEKLLLRQPARSWLDDLRHFDPDIMRNEILNTRKDWQGEGVGVIEAPRGTLFHHYWANDNGQLERVNLIVSTGHNNWAMSTAVDSVAKTNVKGPDVQEGMLNRVEAAIRAYDPCLSCSTHALGQMPIIVDIVDTEGKVMKTLRRDGR